MRKFKVLSLAVSGQGNQIFRNPEIVDESCFPEGHADELVKQRHLEEIIEEAEPSEETGDETPADGVKKAKKK